MEVEICEAAVTRSETKSTKRRTAAYQCELLAQAFAAQVLHSCSRSQVGLWKVYPSRVFDIVRLSGS